MKKRPSKRGVTKYSPKVRKMLFGSRLPFAPTRTQTPLTQEVLLIPQIKRDRQFLPPPEPIALAAIGPPVDTSKDREVLLGAAPTGPKVTMLEELSPPEREHLLRTVRERSRE